MVPRRTKQRTALLVGIPVAAIGFLLGASALEPSPGSEYFWANPAFLELPERGEKLLYVDARNHRNVSIEVEEFLRSEHAGESVAIREALSKCEALPDHGIENRSCQNTRTNSVEIARELLYE